MDQIVYNDRQQFKGLVETVLEDVSQARDLVGSNGFGPTLDGEVAAATEEHYEAELDVDGMELHQHYDSEEEEAWDGQYY